MPKFAVRFFALLAASAGLVASNRAADPAKEVQPKVVKLKDLIAAIKAQKGKVVVVDFWSDG
jgi:hypothetical protein